LHPNGYLFVFYTEPFASGLLSERQRAETHKPSSSPIHETEKKLAGELSGEEAAEGDRTPDTHLLFVDREGWLGKGTNCPL
jgi:hypothetical protein